MKIFGWTLTEFGILMIFNILFVPIVMALFAKAFGHPNSILDLIKEGFRIYLKLF